MGPGLFSIYYRFDVKINVVGEDRHASRCSRFSLTAEILSSINNTRLCDLTPFFL